MYKVKAREIGVEMFQEVCDILNEMIPLDNEDFERNDELLTVEEIANNEKLLNYIGEVLESCDSKDDVREAWNFDEFADYRKYRYNL